MVHVLLLRDIVGYLLKFVGTSDRSSFSNVCKVWNFAWRLRVAGLACVRPDQLRSGLLFKERFPNLKILAVNTAIVFGHDLAVLAEHLGDRIECLRVRVVEGPLLDLRNFVALKELAVGMTFYAGEENRFPFHGKPDCEVRVHKNVRLRKLSLLNMYGRAFSVPFMSQMSWDSVEHLQISSGIALSLLQGIILPSLTVLDVIPFQTSKCFTNSIITDLFKEFSSSEVLTNQFPALKVLRLSCCSMTIIGTEWIQPYSLVELHIDHAPLLRGPSVIESAVTEICCLAMIVRASNMKQVHVYYNRKLNVEDVVTSLGRANKIPPGFEFHSGKWSEKEEEKSV